MLRISFDSALVYRNLDEGDLLKSLAKEQISSGFFKIDSSYYLDWFFEESLGKWIGENIIHYDIYTPNDCVDVFSEVVPRQVL